MLVVFQRVLSASVTVDGDVVGEIGAGAVVLLGVHREDTSAEAEWLAGKVAGLRVFDDDAGRMNLSLVDTGGDALVVSQFTLYGDAGRGNRPSYSDAAPPEVAEPLYEHFVRRLEASLGRQVSTGRFRAMMRVALINDGPVTLLIERRAPTV